MKNLLKASAGAIALMAGAGTAMAQDAGTAGTQQMASDITCSQIIVLDADEAERVLYFVAGYQAAQDRAGMGADSAAAATGTTPTDTTAGADATASAEAPADDTMDPDTTAAAEAPIDPEVTEGATTDTMAADDTPTETDTTTTAGTTADTGLGGEALAATGFIELPVESVMTACADAPESRVSDVMGQQGGSTAQ